MTPAKTTSAPSPLRAATTRRINRQNATAAETVRACKALCQAEETGSDTQAVILALRSALKNLEREKES